MAGMEGSERHGGSGWVLNSNQILFLPSLYMRKFLLQMHKIFSDTQKMHIKICAISNTQ